MRIGGHEAVKSRIMEDVWFAIEMSRRGGRTLSVDLSKAMTTSMYRTIGTMTEGCVKWFYSVAALSPLALVGFFLAAYIFYLAPFYWAFSGPLNAIVESGLWVDWTVSYCAPDCTASAYANYERSVLQGIRYIIYISSTGSRLFNIDCVIRCWTSCRGSRSGVEGQGLSRDHAC